MKPLSTTKLAGLHVTEGVGGVWRYHLSLAGTNAQGLCGAQTMAPVFLLTHGVTKDISTSDIAMSARESELLCYAMPALRYRKNAYGRCR